MKPKSYNEFRDKLLLGLEKTFEKVLEMKKQKNTELVIMQGDEIVSIKPEDFDKLDSIKQY